MKVRNNYDEEGNSLGLMTGSVTLYTERPKIDKPKPREFFIGFHFSAPGPSDEGDYPGAPLKCR